MADSFSDLTTSNNRISNLLGNILKFKNNPAAIQRQSLAYLRDVLDGRVDIVDPTNPFVFLLETSSVNTAAGIIDNEASVRKLYPTLAQTPEDLYLHMSDKDFIDIFASAATAVFTFAAKVDELIDAMVYDGVQGIKKIVIPRNTEFTIAGTTFSMQYPVEIQQLIHGGIEVVYDVDKVSPLQTLSTNVVPREFKRLVQTQDEWIFITLEVQQFKTDSFQTNVSATSGLSKSYTFTDKFYYARVYQKNNDTNNQWVELATTHTEQVHDVAVPTAVLKVIDNKLTVTIPQIYITNNKVRGKLRVDIYQTKGEVNIVMNNYVPSAFGYEFKAIDEADRTQFTAPLSSVRNMLVYSTQTVAGGKNDISFEELRDRVIRNAVGTKNIPITNVQIETAIEDNGYEVVKNTDVVTDRVFLATKPLPTPFDERLITAAASSIQTFITSMADAILHPLVKNNGARITLVPELVYQNNNGIISLVPVTRLDEIANMPLDTQASVITNSNFLYTPFHYVLDNSNDEFEVRPYYLNGPKTNYVTFVSQNDTTFLQVSTVNERVEKVDEGYKLTIVAQGNTAYNSLPDNQIQAQLSFIPIGEHARAYLLGSMVGKTDAGDRVFEFILKTNFDVDSDDYIHFTNFQMFDLEDRVVKAALSSKFDILYTTDATMPIGWSPDKVDSVLGHFQLPPNTAGITNNNVELILGYSLKTLWARSVSQVTGPEYRTYTTDVPLYYEKDVFKTDPATGLDFEIINGEPVFTILHHAGDPVLDDNNNQVYRFKVGDVMLGPDGEPIALTASKISREVDMMFIEGVYYFATDTASSTYRTQIVDTLLSWLMNDLQRLSRNLLEKTKIYFYPKTNMGTIKVMIEDAQITNIDAGQSLNLKFYVTNDVYKNSELRADLSRTAIQVIDTQLKKDLVSKDEILSELRSALASDVLAIDISGLGGQFNLSAFTVLESSQRASLRKKLTSLPNMKLIAEEDVTIDFILHQQVI